ncbi:MAG: hypothetical protein NXI24_05205 [bacterium]|nr:hypothetical protein [bacterium]
MSDSADIIFRSEDGRVITREELAGVSGTIHYEIPGDDRVPDAVRDLHEQARQAGGAGDYGRAEELLRLAMEGAPTWPYPPYDLAFTYLLQDDAEQALRYYQETDRLAPRGFFTTKTAVDTLGKEAAGAFPPGLYRAYVQLEWIDDRQQQIEFLVQLTEQVPLFAPAWKDLAGHLDDQSERLAALETGLSHSPDATTKSMLLVNRGLALDQLGRREEAIATLGAVALDEDTAPDARHLAKFALQSIVG